MHGLNYQLLEQTDPQTVVMPGMEGCVPSLSVRQLGAGQQGDLQGEDLGVSLPLLLKDYYSHRRARKRFFVLSI